MFGVTLPELTSYLIKIYAYSVRSLLLMNYDAEVIRKYDSKTLVGLVMMS